MLQTKSGTVMICLSESSGEYFLNLDGLQNISIPGYSDNLGTLIIEDAAIKNKLNSGQCIYLKNEKNPAHDDRLHLPYLLLMPLHNSKTLSAIIVAGRSDRPFTDSEIDISNLFLPLYAYIFFSRLSYYEQLEKNAVKGGSLIAGEIQNRLLANNFTESEFASLSLQTIPAEGVNSDYHDFNLDHKNRLFSFYIADITGKNIHHATQAIIMVRTLFELLLKSRYDADKIFKIVNSFFVRDEKLENFAQISLIQYYQEKGKLYFTSAGNSIMIIFRLAGQKIDIIEKKELAFGIDEKHTYPVIERDVQSGDIIMTFTDGLLEAMDERDHQFGKEWLGKIISDHYFLQPEDLKERILQELSLIRGSTLNKDDITMAILKIY